MVPASPIIVVLSGPGGAGKGTVARAVAEADPHLSLSRSWTTRQPRAEDAGDDYVFVDEATFRAKVADDGFLEWAEFLGNLYGSPRPEEGSDDVLLLEIELQGARQVLEREPSATLILLLPPSEEEQAARLRARGDDEAHVERRLAKGREEAAEGRAIAHHVVVNQDLGEAISEVRGIIEALRSQRA